MRGARGRGRAKTDQWKVRSSSMKNLIERIRVETLSRICPTVPIVLITEGGSVEGAGAGSAAGAEARDASIRECRTPAGAVGGRAASSREDAIDRGVPQLQTADRTDLVGRRADVSRSCRLDRAVQRRVSPPVGHHVRERRGCQCCGAGTQAASEPHHPLTLPAVVYRQKEIIQEKEGALIPNVLLIRNGFDQQKSRPGPSDLSVRKAA